MISNFHAIVFEHHQFLFQLNQLFYTIIVIVRGLRRRRTDILDVGESTLDERLCISRRLRGNIHFASVAN